jgi:hypothetical protein
MKMETKLNTGTWSVVAKNKHHGYYIENEAGETVCDLYFKTSLNEIVEHGFMTKEHAHLIAAAPEMYEEIQSDIDHLERQMRFKTENDEMLRLLKQEHSRKIQLLAKARGEQ